MSESEALEEFWEGLALLRGGKARDALLHLHRSLRLDAGNAFYLSYLGLAIGTADGNWDRAEDLCQNALSMDWQQPDLYLNMAEVYRRTGKKDDAVWILKAGLQMTGHDGSLREALNRLGVRQPRVLTFLDRRHYLNRNLGKLRHFLLAARRQMV